MKKLQFIDIGKPFRIIGKICKDIERAFRFKGINVNFIVMMIDYIGFAFILKWNLQPEIKKEIPVSPYKPVNKVQHQKKEYSVIRIKGLQISFDASLEGMDVTISKVLKALQ